MTDPTILITGGTGKTGRRIAAQLKDAGHSCVIASRSGSSIYGHQAVRFDWSNRLNHADVLLGIDAVYLVAPPNVAEPLTAMRPFIDLALKQGIRRFVLLSASLLEEGGPMVGTVHSYLKQNTPEWAVLRPTWFMQNFSEEYHMSSILDESRIYSATFDGRVPFVDTSDIAAVACSALLRHDSLNRDVVITGPKALSYCDVAKIISSAIGLKIDHIKLTEGGLTKRFVAQGMNENYARALASLDTMIAGGAETRLTNEVELLTGRTPKNLETFAREMRKVWLSD
ncbi:ergot alkaloid biosynthesis protein [Limnobaculum parvum]|uniref:Ergot alkaloid biosynthesis protein n=1 Tax=Limnobaculum parvum TaxID=2172103 RepID=A0A2Y9TZQ3_9GAMM|nr:ergot alkaloid biosynthesis protein [Limnobaculum parvum]AWH89268.1 ergot alkaloid biosynthesis protein [Limnobaculum parvum]